MTCHVVPALTVLVQGCRDSNLPSYTKQMTKRQMSVPMSGIHQQEGLNTHFSTRSTALRREWAFKPVYRPSQRVQR